jgi:hypothetical protein
MSCQAKPFHRVYMLFTLHKNWKVSFLEADLMVSPLRRLIFADPDEIRDLARLGQALATSEARVLFDYSIGRGNGGLYLQLTTEQYSKLREPGCARDGRK